MVKYYSAKSNHKGTKDTKKKELQSRQKQLFAINHGSELAGKLGKASDLQSIRRPTAGFLLSWCSSCLCGSST
jgi:hypothetical protein